MSKSLMYAAFLPHLQQRRINLVENFGLILLRFALAMCACVAIMLVSKQ
jgi:hypothetical protein